MENWQSKRTNLIDACVLTEDVKNRIEDQAFSTEAYLLNPDAVFDGSDGTYHINPPKDLSGWAMDEDGEKEQSSFMMDYYYLHIDYLLRLNGSLLH